MKNGGLLTTSTLSLKSIGKGSLAINKFQYYLRQDYVFLINYCKVLAISASKSSSEKMMKRWVGLLNETLNSEMDLHRNFVAILEYH